MRVCFVWSDGAAWNVEIVDYRKRGTYMRIRTHPGETLLEEFLKPLGLTAHGLAFAIGVPCTRIADIVRQRRGVSADTAIRLARYFGTTAEFWCSLQSAHELSVVEEAKRQELARIIPHGQQTVPAPGSAFVNRRRDRHSLRRLQGKERRTCPFRRDMAPALSQLSLPAKARARSGALSNSAQAAGLVQK